MVFLVLEINDVGSQGLAGRLRLLTSTCLFSLSLFFLPSSLALLLRLLHFLLDVLGLLQFLLLVVYMLLALPLR